MQEFREVTTALSVILIFGQNKDLDSQGSPFWQHENVNRIKMRMGALESFCQGYYILSLIFLWVSLFSLPSSPRSSFLFALALSFSLLLSFFSWKYSNKLHKPPSENRKILNWTIKGTRHKAILQYIWRKEEINRIKFLFTCWPATHFTPSVMFFFTILEVCLLLIFSYFIRYSHWYLCLGLSHNINMWLLCNY